MYRFRQYVTASSTSSWVDGKCPGGTSFHKSRESNSFVDILCKFVGDKQRGVPAPSQILLSLQLSLEPEKKNNG